MAKKHVRPSSFEAHLRDEHQIGRFSESLREIVYGGNDGIVTTFAVVAGFAGAASDGVAAVGTIAVLLFGLANLFADAAAMGLGAFLSSRSQQEVYDAIRAKELHEIRHNPAMERRETIGKLRSWSGPSFTRSCGRRTSPSRTSPASPISTSGTRNCTPIS